MKSTSKRRKGKKTGGRSLIFKFVAALLALALLCAAGAFYWAQQPIVSEGKPIEFSVRAGSSVNASAQQIADAGVPVNPLLFELLVRLSGNAGRLKAGHYELKPSETPMRLMQKLVRGEFSQEALTIIEGWTFKQMRQTLGNHPALTHDTAQLSDDELMAKIAPDYKHPEGLFFPDTYLFAKGTSDWLIYRQAHAAMMKRLGEQWQKRDTALPYKSAYEALIMASIVEKETGQKSERNMIAGVFVNRLKKGMLLQTDPTVIYGMGESYQGNIRKRDLQTDTPYNTYTRAGLPPTPIALPGAQSLAAAFNPANTDALYFVARGDGSSQFSGNLDDHNRAVNQYQRKIKTQQSQ